MKTTIAILFGILCSAATVAADTGPLIVTATAVGYPDNGPYYEEQAKRECQQIAQRLCGDELHARVQLNGDLKVSYEGGVKCPPRTFCSPEPPNVVVEGQFICLDNLPQH